MRMGNNRLSHGKVWYIDKKKEYRRHGSCVSYAWSRMIAMYVAALFGQQQI
jgi:hypothetical protein